MKKFLLGLLVAAAFAVEAKVYTKVLPEIVNSFRSPGTR